MGGDLRVRIREVGVERKGDRRQKEAKERAGDGGGKRRVRMWGEGSEGIMNTLYGSQVLTDVSELQCLSG